MVSRKGAKRHGQVCGDFLECKERIALLRLLYFPSKLGLDRLCVEVGSGTGSRRLVLHFDARCSQEEPKVELASTSSVLVWGIETTARRGRHAELRKRYTKPKQRPSAVAEGRFAAKRMRRERLTLEKIVVEDRG
jgi:hypothetical protein